MTKRSANRMYNYKATPEQHRILKALAAACGVPIGTFFVEMAIRLYPDKIAALTERPETTRAEADRDQ